VCVTESVLRTCLGFEAKLHQVQLARLQRSAEGLQLLLELRAVCKLEQLLSVSLPIRQVLAQPAQQSSGTGSQQGACCGGAAEESWQGAPCR
jgi:hypothetical protein